MKIKLTRPEERVANNYNWIVGQLVHKLNERCGHNEMEAIMMELGCDAMSRGIYEEQEIHDVLMIMSEEAGII